MEKQVVLEFASQTAMAAYKSGQFGRISQQDLGYTAEKLAERGLLKFVASQAGGQAICLDEVAVKAVAYFIRAGIETKLARIEKEVRFQAGFTANAAFGMDFASIDDAATKVKKMLADGELSTARVVASRLERELESLVEKVFVARVESLAKRANEDATALVKVALGKATHRERKDALKELVRKLEASASRKKPSSLTLTVCLGVAALKSEASPRQATKPELREPTAREKRRGNAGFNLRSLNGRSATEAIGATTEH